MQSGSVIWKAKYRNVKRRQKSINKLTKSWKSQRAPIQDDWKLDQLLQIFTSELEARERAAGPSSSKVQVPPPKGNRKAEGTAATLLAGSSIPTCTNCRGKHPSKDCQTVTDVLVRKDLLRKYGSCFVCLRKDHISRNCPSKSKCHICSGKHHVSICQANLTRAPPVALVLKQQRVAVPSGNDSVVCYANSSTPVLLQTAQAVVFNPQQPDCKVKVRIILDSDSQRTYLTDNLKNTLRLPSQQKKQVSIKTFGSTDERLAQVDVVAFGIELNGEPDLLLSAFTVPLICQPLQSQPVDRVIGDNKCFSGLRLADYSTGEQNLDVDVLIGSDYYWNLVTGHTIRGSQGPTAVHTKLGWVLSGPVGSGDAEDLQRNNLVTTHVLKCATEPVSYEGLEGELSFGTWSP